MERYGKIWDNDECFDFLGGSLRGKATCNIPTISRLERILWGGLKTNEDLGEVHNVYKL